MFSFIFKRLLQALLVMLVISFIGYSVKDKIGDPIYELVGQSVSEKERDILRVELGLDKPLLVQYGRFLKNILKGDFGRSYQFKQPTLQVIIERLPATLELVLITSLIVVALSIPLGIYTAVHPKRWQSKLIMGVSIVGISTPVFLIGVLLIYVFSVQFGWLPSYGRGETVDLGFWETGLLTIDGLKHIIMPACALSFIMLPLFIRLIRSEMLEALQSEYVRFAYAKGMPDKLVWNKHAFRNTLLPVITVGGLQIGVLVAYTILTETVFQWPGIGLMFYTAISHADVPLIITYIMVVGFFFIMINTIVDIIYGYVDPRVRFSGEQ